MNKKYFSIVAGTDYFLCALFQKVVDVYRIKDLRQINSIKSLFGFGGKRLALCEEQKIFCSADYYDGIAGYDPESGNQKWRNPKIKQIQTVFATERHVLVHTAKDKLQLLAINSGEIIRVIDKVLNIYDTNNRNSYISRKKNNFDLVSVENDDLIVQSIPWLKADESLFYNISMLGDKFLVFIADKSFQSFSRGGELLWTSELASEFMVIGIYYSEDKTELYCFASLDIKIKMEYYMIRIDLGTGKVIDKYSVNGAFEIALSNDGQSVFCNNGPVLDVKTGKQIGNFGE
jgi:hypothetical protein